MKYAVTVAGNIVVDTTKYIAAYPQKLELTAIESMEKSIGGSVPNVGIDICKLDPSVQVKAVGFVGADENGTYALNELKKVPNLDISDVLVSGITSFTDVMTVKSTGERTFFTYKGADSLNTDKTIPYDRLDCGIFHLAYALLLDGMDREDPEYGTVMARTLCEVQKQGIRTSVDVVSENSDRYRKIVIPALKYTDYFSVNEMEAERITGIPLVRDGALIEANVETALKKLKELGVKRCTVIHTPSLSCGLDENDEFVKVPTLKLPKGYIKGSVGAGDAFTAGLLLMLYRGESLKKAIETANIAAAMSLGTPGATDGIIPIDEFKGL